MIATQTPKALKDAQEVTSARDPALDARLRRIVNDEYAFVWRMLRRLGVRPPSTDDAAQRVFLILSQKLASVDVGGERRYLCGIIFKVASKARRSQARLREVPEEEASEPPAETPSAEALLDRKQAREIVDAILARMSEEHRTAFVLFEFEGMSTREIADVLELPMGTVASRLRRARDDFKAAALRERLKRKGERQS